MEIFRNFQSAELEGQTIRATPGSPKRVSVYDLIKAVTGHASYRQTWKDISMRYPEVVYETDAFKFPGKGQRETPVVGAKGLVTIVNLLQGERAARFRAAEADVLVRYLGGDLGLIDEIRGIRRAQEALPADDPARIFGEAAEARARLPLDPQEIFQLRDAAVALAGARQDVEATADAVRAFPIVEYREQTAAKREDVAVRHEDVAVRRLDLALKKEELDHRRADLVVKRQELDLEDRREAAKRPRTMCPPTRTEDTVSVPEVLAKLCAGLVDGAALIKRFHEQRMGQRAYQRFKDDCVPTGGRPLRYQKDAEPGMREMISEWLGTNVATPRDRGIHRYFQPVGGQPAAGDGGDLYD